MRELCRVQAKVPGLAKASTAEKRSNLANAVWIIIDGRHSPQDALKASSRSGKAPSRDTSRQVPAFAAGPRHRPDRRRRCAVDLSRRLRPADYRPTEARTRRSAGSTTTGAAKSCPNHAAECRAYVTARGKTGGARADLETFAPRSTTTPKKVCITASCACFAAERPAA